MRKDLIITALLTFCLTATIFMVATSQSAEYDPWVDLNDDGKIDIFDVVGMTSRYAATGDPTKNVSVISMPPTNDVNVWWNDYFPASTTDYTTEYHTSGFGQLHALIYAYGLGAGETLDLVIEGQLANPGHSSYILIPAYTATLTETSYTRDITIPVPSERFSFRASTDAASTCYVYMSFYLTYA